jgi:hypothetical protein
MNADLDALRDLARTSTVSTNLVSVSVANSGPGIAQLINHCLNSDVGVSLTA